MHRVHEVIDAWFDSGSMPFAQWHYPFENAELFRERFPADFIAEAIDQTRGWFYSLLAIATLVEDRSSYKRVLCLGHILDADGQKMSKSKGNVVQPDDILDHQGADAFRWFMFSSQQPWSPRRFGAEMVDEVVRKFLLTLWNTYSFFTVYANIDGFDPLTEPVPLEERPLLDRWLVGELNTLVLDVTDGLEAYDATGTCRAHPAVRRRPQQLVRAPQPASLLEVGERRRQAGRLPDAVRGARHGDQAAGAVHAVRGRGAVPEPGARRGPGGAGERAPVRLAGGRRAGHRRRRVVRHGGRAARGRAGPRRAQRRRPSRRGSRWPRWSSRCRGPSCDAVERLREVVIDELNVKALRLAGDESELVAYTVKPNLKVLGPRLGKQLGALQAVLREADTAALVAELRSAGSVTLTAGDGEVSLVEDDLLIETGSPEGYQVEAEGGRTVALATTVDEALHEEGVARELVHAVQLARKNAGLRIEDTIRLALAVPRRAGRRRGAPRGHAARRDARHGAARGRGRRRASRDGARRGPRRRRRPHRDRDDLRAARPAEQRPAPRGAGDEGRRRGTDA